MAQSNETTPAWYKEQLGSRLTPLMKRLFQSYSGIAEDAIEKHVTDIVRISQTSCYSEVFNSAHEGIHLARSSLEAIQISLHWPVSVLVFPDSRLAIL